MSENPYQAPQTCNEATSPADSTSLFEVGYWLLVLVSPLFVFGGLAIGQWLFPP